MNSTKSHRIVEFRQNIYNFAIFSNFMWDHEKYMKRCLELAANGIGLVYPNPMVGSVVVHNNMIIGEGWHRRAGAPHAEVVAIASVKEKKLLQESTLYVNLEPCSHYGRTPPCADLIIRKGIKKVVIGSVDSSEKVGGKGVDRLRKNGIEVVTPVLENACRELNKRFFTFHEKKRPYVILKWAQSRDGYIFPEVKKSEKGRPFWISNPYSLQRVHQWRAEEAAILVGKHTALQDNPKLNLRNYAGHPILRIAIDQNLEIPESANLLDRSCDTIIYNKVKDKAEGKLQFAMLDFKKEITAQVMEHLHGLEVQSLVVEGGAFTLNSFISSGNWDEIRVFEGEHNLNGGLEAPELCGHMVKKEQLEDNSLRIYKRL